MTTEKDLKYTPIRNGYSDVISLRPIDRKRLSDDLWHIWNIAISLKGLINVDDVRQDILAHDRTSYLYAVLTTCLEEICRVSAGLWPCKIDENGNANANEFYRS